MFYILQELRLIDHHYITEIYFEIAFSLNKQTKKIKRQRQVTVMKIVKIYLFILKSTKGI